MIDDGRLLDHHGMQSAQMSQIYGARGASSNSSPGGHHVHPNSAGLLVVPQPINASKMGAALPNGTGRKYQCKMCPQVGAPEWNKLSLTGRKLALISRG